MDMFCSSPTPKVRALTEEDWLPSNHEDSNSSTDRLTNERGQFPSVRKYFPEPATVEVRFW